MGKSGRLQPSTDSEQARGVKGTILSPGRMRTRRVGPQRASGLLRAYSVRVRVRFLPATSQLLGIRLITSQRRKLRFQEGMYLPPDHIASYPRTPRHTDAAAAQAKGRGAQSRGQGLGVRSKGVPQLGAERGAETSWAWWRDGCRSRAEVTRAGNEPVREDTQGAGRRGAEVGRRGGGREANLGGPGEG